MTADITVRLRAADEHDGLVCYRNPDGPEAAAEIDRLRKIIAMWERCAVMTREAFGNCICPKEYP